MQHSSVSKGELKINVYSWTVVNPSREQHVLIFFLSLQSVFHLYAENCLAVTGSSADLWDPKCHLLSIVRGN